MPTIAYTWKTGHALKMIVSSNNARRWDVNLNNGGDMYTAGDTNVVQVQIHHSNTYPSVISLATNSLPTLASSIPESKLNNKVIYPNPTTNILNIRTAENINQVQIFSIDGKLEGTYYKSTFSINNLKKGTYFMQVNTEKESFIRKIEKL